MPPAAPEIATASLIMTSVVLLVAALLAWREWVDRRARDPDLSPEDYAHFAGQDARRSIGIVVLVLLAAGVAVGSRTPSRMGNQANPQFVGIWLGVFVLIFVALSLAMLDWVALRRYAKRQRGQILRERLEILREQARLKKSAGEEGNGHGDGPLGDLFDGS
jgi:membrane protein implicated in regulation of membrane protease activity